MLIEKTETNFNFIAEILLDEINVYVHDMLMTQLFFVMSYDSLDISRKSFQNQ